MLRQALEGDFGAGGRGDEQLAKVRGAPALGLGEAHDQVKGVAPFENAGHGDALDGRLHRLCHLAHGQTVAGDGVAVEVGAEDRDVRLRFDREVHHAGHRLHGLARLGGQQAQLVEVVAEDLDGDVGAGAGEHVVNAVGDGLADDDVHAGNEGEVAAQRLEQFLFGPLPHLQGHVNFGGLDALGVFVQLGAALAAGDAGDFGMGEEGALDEVAILVGLFEGGAGQGNRAEGERALVELGQEGAAHEHRGAQGQHQHDGGGHGHAPRMREHGRQDSRVMGFQPGDHLRLLAFPHGSAARAGAGDTAPARR